MIRESEIQERLLALRGGRLSLEAFEAWIGPASVGMHSSSPAAAVRLASQIHHLYSDYEDGRIRANELKRSLLGLLDGSVVVLPHSEPSFIGQSSTSWAPVAQEWVVALQS